MNPLAVLDDLCADLLIDGLPVGLRDRFAVALSRGFPRDALLHIFERYVRKIGAKIPFALIGASYFMDRWQGPTQFLDKVYVTEEDFVLVKAG